MKDDSASVFVGLECCLWDLGRPGSAIPSGIDRHAGKGTWRLPSSCRSTCERTQGFYKGGWMVILKRCVSERRFTKGTPDLARCPTDDKDSDYETFSKGMGGGRL
jgi:hypothetical protein